MRVTILHRSRGPMPQIKRRCRPERLVLQPCPAPGPSHGYFLVEYLVYIAVLAIVLGVAFGAFYRCLSNSTALNRNTEDILRALQAGELWRADIRAAAGPMRAVNEPDLIALEIPTARGRVAYVFSNSAVWRQDGEAAAREILPRVKDSRMMKDSRGGVESWRWELELLTKTKKVRVRPLFSFQATPLP